MRILTAMALAVLIATSAAAQDDSQDSQDGLLYKWVDEDGNVTYQDRPPPGGGEQVETLVDPSVGEASSAPPAPDVDVTLYSIKVCDACDLLRELLRDRGIAFEEKNAEDNQEVQTELREVAGVLSVPVLLIGDEVLTGYNRELILKELEDVGFSTRVVESGETGSAQRETTAPTDDDASGEDTGADGQTEDDDFALDDDFFSDEDDDTGGDDVSEWEEIPEDERIDVNQ